MAVLNAFVHPNSQTIVGTKDGEISVVVALFSSNHIAAQCTWELNREDAEQFVILARAFLDKMEVPSEVFVTEYLIIMSKDDDFVVITYTNVQGQEVVSYVTPEELNDLVTIIIDHYRLSV